MSTEWLISIKHSHTCLFTNCECHCTLEVLKELLFCPSQKGLLLVVGILTPYSAVLGIQVRSIGSWSFLTLQNPSHTQFLLRQIIFVPQTTVSYIMSVAKEKIKNRGLSTLFCYSISINKHSWNRRAKRRVIYTEVLQNCWTWNPNRTTIPWEVFRFIGKPPAS